MRILWVSHAPLIGGAEMCLAEGVDALVERGHEVHVVMPGEGPLRDRLGTAASVRVVWQNLWATIVLPSWPSRVRQMAVDVQAARELARVARELDVDVVMSNTLTIAGGALGARFARRPHAWFVHEYGLEDHGVRFHFGRRPSLAAMDRLSEVVIVNSEALRSHFARWIPEAKLQRVHYAVEIDAASQPHGGPDAGDDRYRIVLVGTRAPGKGQQDAIAAVGHLAAEGIHVQLDLIGPGGSDFDRHLRALAADAGVADRVHFHDFREDRLTAVSAADVVLMCSRSEAFGRITVEALKLGRPIVGAAAGATPELVRDGLNGFLYPAGDAPALAERIRRLHDDRDAAEQMGRRGQEWALETFSRARYGADLEAALARATRANPAGARAPVPAAP